MSQHRGAPRRFSAAPFDDGEDEYYQYVDVTARPYSSAQYSFPPPPHRGGEYYLDDQYNWNGYTDPSPLQIVRTSSSYSPPPPRRRPHPATRRYAVIDDVTDDEYYCLNPEDQPPPRRRGEFPYGRQYYRDAGSHHPIQTLSSYSRPSRPRSPPPPLGDVVSMEVARGLQRIIPSLVDVGIAKFQQMAISMRREMQTPEARVTVETINRQENEARRGDNQDMDREGDETNESVNVNADPQARRRNNQDGDETNESIN